MNSDYIQIICLDYISIMKFRLHSDYLEKKYFCYIT